MQEGCSAADLFLSPLMPDRPLFTVVIPYHNKGELVLAALRSVEQQTFRGYELLLVDDASTDGGLHSLPAFDFPSFRILRRDVPGSGGYAARNCAIRASSAPYIAFLDADDVWAPDHLDAFVELVKQYPDCDLFLSGFTEIQGAYRKQVLFKSTCQSLSAAFLERYAFADCIHTNSVVAPASRLLAVGGFPENGIRRAGDHVLWLRLLLLGGSIAVSERMTSLYRRDHSSVVTNPGALSSRHPVSTEVARVLSAEGSLPAGWGRRECHLLRTLSNRKAIFWLLQLKGLGRFKPGDLRIVYFTDLNPGSALKVCLLVAMPSLIWRLLVGVRDVIRRAN